eukprot:5282478-Prymnesium_polylepis.1
MRSLISLTSSTAGDDGASEVLLHVYFLGTAEASCCDVVSVLCVVGAVLGGRRHTGCDVFHRLIEGAPLSNGLEWSFGHAPSGSGVLSIRRWRAATHSTNTARPSRAAARDRAGRAARPLTRPVARRRLPPRAAQLPELLRRTVRGAPCEAAPALGRPNQGRPLHSGRTRLAARLRSAGPRGAHVGAAVLPAAARPPPARRRRRRQAAARPARRRATRAARSCSSTPQGHRCRHPGALDQLDGALPAPQALKLEAAAASRGPARDCATHAWANSRWRLPWALASMRLWRVEQRPPARDGKWGVACKIKATGETVGRTCVCVLRADGTRHADGARVGDVCYGPTGRGTRTGHASGTRNRHGGATRGR